FLKLSTAGITVGFQEVEFGNESGLFVLLALIRESGRFQQLNHGAQFTIHPQRDSDGQRLVEPVPREFRQQQLRIKSEAKATALLAVWKHMQSATDLQSAKAGHIIALPQR